MTQQQNNQGTTLKVSSPERILRLLGKVSETGLTVQIRSLKQPEVAVKGRASNAYPVSVQQGFSISGISERGMAHLLSLTEFGFQVEFVLTNTKVVFNAGFLALDGTTLKVKIPNLLSSVERRKDSRYPVTQNTRAYIKVLDFFISAKDDLCPPFLEYQRDMANWLAIGDMSSGGISLVSRFPMAYKVLPRGRIVEQAQLLLPLAAPLPVAFEVRWTKRLKEGVQDIDGSSRSIKIFKFGLQFVQPSEVVQTELQKFMAKLAYAEAI